MVGTNEAKRGPPSANGVKVAPPELQSARHLIVPILSPIVNPDAANAAGMGKIADPRMLEVVTWLLEYAQKNFNTKGDGEDASKYMKYMNKKDAKKKAKDAAGRNNVGMDSKKQKAFEATIRYALANNPTKVRRIVRAEVRSSQATGSPKRCPSHSNFQ